MEKTHTHIRVSVKTVTLINKYRMAILDRELERLGDKADLNQVFGASVDEIVHAALRVALAPPLPINTAPAVDPHAAAHAKHQAAIVEKFPAPVENDATNE